MKKYINLGLLTAAVGSLTSIVWEQFQQGAGLESILQVTATTLIALSFGLLRDDDGDGVKNINDRAPENPDEA